MGQKICGMAITYTVIYKPEAQKRLDGILEEMIEAKSMKVAADFYNRFLDDMDKVARMPSARPLETRFKRLSETEYRHIEIKPYSVVYTVEEAINSVAVVMIHHIKRGPDFFNQYLP